MQQNPKAVVIVGVGAMALALLAGLLGGVAFGALLLRALLGGLIFAGAAFGVQLLLRQFLPELFEAFGSAPQGDKGTRVNMVVDEEVDLLTPVQEPQEDGEVGESEDSGETPGAEDEEELVEEVSEVGSEGDLAAPIPKVPDVDVSSVDKLPNLDGFVQSFADDGTVEIVDEDDGSPAMPGGQDAETIAKAIKTVMKRDE